MEFAVGPAGSLGLRLVFSETPSPSLTYGLLSIQTQAQRKFAGALVDSIVGYTTLTLFFQPLALDRERTQHWLEERATSLRLTANEPEASCKTVTLPVLYHPSVAPDLEWLAGEKNLSVDDVIERHSGSAYFAYATGFAPGFCYLGTVDAQLTTPRLTTPRASVDAGSVAIADRQTAVYPCVSPGGWRLIGACPTPLFDLASNPAALIAVGDSVKFEPVTMADYRALKAKLNNA